MSVSGLRAGPIIVFKDTTMKALRLRLAVSLIVLLVVLAYALPNLPSIGNSFLGTFMQARINLGLDLKGGMNLTLGVDVEKAIQNTLTVTGQDISDRARQEKLTVMKPRLNGQGLLEVTLPRADQAEAYIDGAGWGVAYVLKCLVQYLIDLFRPLTELLTSLTAA